MEATLKMMQELGVFSTVRGLEEIPSLYKKDEDPRLFAAAFKGIFRFACKTISTFNIDEEEKVSIVLERLHFALKNYDGRGKFLTFYGKILKNALLNAQRGEAFKMRNCSGYFAPLEVMDEDGVLHERTDFKLQNPKVVLSEPLNAAEEDCLWVLGFAKKTSQAKRYMLHAYGNAGLKAIGESVKRKLVYN